jgi:hypothetical protein
MKRTLLILGLSATHCISAMALTVEQIRSWESVLARNEFTNTLYALAHETSWPVVYSPQHAAKLDAAEEKTQQLFRDLSYRLVVGLQGYVPQMKEMSVPDFARSADLLLDARDRLSNKPSYINMVLIDSINRVLFYNLALRLSTQDVDLPKLSPIVERLRQYKPAMVIFLDVTSTEMGKPLLGELSVATMRDVEIYRKLWPVLEGDAPLVFPKEMQNVGSLTLLNNRDAGLLLWRLALTDYQVNTVLPALVEYRQKVENYSIDDDYQKIKRTIGRELKHQSLGAEVAGVTLAGEGVSELLYRVRCGKLQQQLLFEVKGLPAR